MQILADADALPRPIAEVLFRAAERTGVPLVLVANKSAHVPASDPIRAVAVPEGPDVADDRIAEMAQPGDLVVTADIPLADRVVAKGATGVDVRGQLYTEENIKERLAVRDLLSTLRDGGAVTGGPAPFGRKDVQAFANQLDRFLTKHMRGTP